MPLTAARIYLKINSPSKTHALRGIPQTGPHGLLLRGSRNLHDSKFCFDDNLGKQGLEIDSWCLDDHLPAEEGHLRGSGVVSALLVTAWSDGF